MAPDSVAMMNAGEHGPGRQVLILSVATLAASLLTALSYAMLVVHQLLESWSGQAKQHTHGHVT